MYGGEEVRVKSEEGGERGRLRARGCAENPVNGTYQEKRST